MLSQLATRLFLSLITFYQKGISPFIPARCRYYPTCSCYAKQAIHWHGVWQGGWLAVKRIGRCHPLGGHGIDFVPVPMHRYQYFYIGKPNQYSQPNKLDFISHETFDDYIDVPCEIMIVAKDKFHKDIRISNVPHEPTMFYHSVYQGHHDYKARLNYLMHQGNH